MELTIWHMDIIILDIELTLVMESSSMGNLAIAASMAGLDMTSLNMVGKGRTDQVANILNIYSEIPSTNLSCPTWLSTSISPKDVGRHGMIVGRSGCRRDLWSLPYDTWKVQSWKIWEMLEAWPVWT
ncbi:hypothetical protein VNO78_09358 [Psophocarpus tetragonolobus]|uniref:Uncharacterized protein n=1 Tax=Psophocarpus tetragonolobus TaxID=3891 RepID=A0AAN9XUB7_PSOTE